MGLVHGGHVEGPEHPVLLRRDTCRINTARQMGPREAFLTSWGKNEPTINCVMEIRMPSSWRYSETEFGSWVSNVQEALQRTFEYAAFGSIVAKVHPGALQPTQYVWSELPPDISNHVSVHTESIAGDDPSSDIMGKVVHMQEVPFDHNLPRWHASIHRYVDTVQGRIGGGESVPVAQTRAVFVVLRVGHMLSDGVSLMSMLLTSVFGESAGAEPLFPVRTTDAHGQDVANSNAMVGKLASFKEPLGTMQLARFDTEWSALQRVYKSLTERWGIRVTMTSLMHAAACRALCRPPQAGDAAGTPSTPSCASLLPEFLRADGSRTIFMAMPRDDRGAELNRVRSSDDFRAKVRGYAEAQKSGSDTNLASGGAHALRGFRVTSDTLDDWKQSYESVAAALERVYMEEAQKAMETYLTLKARRMAIATVAGTMDYMLSSINAGPQRCSLAGQDVTSFSIVLIPTYVYERSMMLLRSGSRMSVSIAAPDACDWAQQVQEELIGLQRLLQQ